MSRRRTNKIPTAFYTNENFLQRTVEALCRLGHEVMTSHDAGNSNIAMPDDEVVKYATRLGLAVITLNRKDFIRLHARNSGHSGIVVCTADTDYEGLAQRIHEGVGREDNVEGKLIRITRPHA